MKEVRTVPKGDYEIVKARFVECRRSIAACLWLKGTKKCKLMLAAAGRGEFDVSKDRRTLLYRDVSPPGLSKSERLGVFLWSLCARGFKGTSLDTGDISCLEGLKLSLRTIPTERDRWGRPCVVVTKLLA